jgi:PAS domain S-box-containing protein
LISDPEETYGNELRVLLFLTESRDAASIPLVLERIGVVSMICSTPEEVSAEIENGAGALLLEEEGLSRSMEELLFRILERQPPWSELPIIILLRHGPETQAARDALLLPWDMTLVERPVRVNTLVAIVRSALRSRRRQYLVRDQLRALDESETRYRTLFNSIDEGFCIIELIFDDSGEPIDFRFVETSPSFERQTGLINAKGRRVLELVPTLEGFWLEMYGRVALRGEGSRFDGRFEQLQRWFDVYAFPFGPAENRQVAIVFNDITEQKRAESELRAAKEELEARVRERTRELTQALERVRYETEERLLKVEELRLKDQLLMQQSRLAAMGEMIGFVAHQWRQPLNSLGLIAQEVSFRYKKGMFDEQYLNSATAETMRVIRQMSQTLDDFRNFFKPERLKVPFKVIEIVTSTIKLIEASFREYNVKLDISAEDDVVVEGYPNEYSQVLLNILMNARDICLERQVEQARIEIRVFSEGGRAVATIADNAGGIPEQIMDRIFDPYFTTKGPDRGTGVGLYMAKTIIERNMNGRLTVCNTPEGAEFRIEV